MFVVQLLVELSGFAQFDARLDASGTAIGIVTVCGFARFWRFAVGGGRRCGFVIGGARGHRPRCIESKNARRRPFFPVRASGFFPEQLGEFKDAVSPGLRARIEAIKPRSKAIASSRLLSRFFSVDSSILLSSADSTGACGDNGRLRRYK